MSDLIDRQVAIDAMNARLEDIKLTWRGKVKKGEIAMYLDMRGAIETLPSAQPEIIRCKDCKFRYTDGENVTANYCLLNHNRVQADDWFCADGERKEE